MKFSIVVIAYNQKATVCSAIDSVLKQTHSDLEVIYVDDASTDGSAAAVKAHFADSRLHVIEHGENQGCVISRLDGAAYASGDWVLFLDGDDTFREDTCAVLEETVRQSCPEADSIGFGLTLCCDGSVTESAKRNIERLAEQPCLGELSGSELTEELYLKRSKAWMVCNKCYSRSLVQRVVAAAKREKIVHLEDFYLSFLFCDMTERYFGIPQQLYRYSFGGGISSSQKLSYNGFVQYLSSVKSPQLAAEYAKSRGLFEKYSPVFDAVAREIMIGSYSRFGRISDEDKPLAALRYMETFGDGLEKMYYDILKSNAVIEEDSHRIGKLEDAIEQKFGELDECRAYIQKIEGEEQEKNRALDECRTYIQKLEQDLQIKDRDLGECRTYIQKLEQDIQTKDRDLDECRAYIQKLEGGTPS